MACAPVLDKLPVKTDVQVFGRVDVSEADVIVPNIWRAGQSLSRPTSI